MAFEQLTPLGELTIRWTGSEDGELEISDEFDVPAGTASEDSDDREGAGDEPTGDGTRGPEPTGNEPTGREPTTTGIVGA